MSSTHVHATSSMIRIIRAWQAVPRSHRHFTESRTILAAGQVDPAGTTLASHTAVASTGIRPSSGCQFGAQRIFVPSGVSVLWRPRFRTLPSAANFVLAG